MGTNRSARRRTSVWRLEELERLTGSHARRKGRGDLRHASRDALHGDTGRRQVTLNLGIHSIESGKNRNPARPESLLGPETKRWCERQEVFLSEQEIGARRRLIRRPEQDVMRQSLPNEPGQSDQP